LRHDSHYGRLPLGTIAIATQCLNFRRIWLWFGCGLFSLTFSLTMPYEFVKIVSMRKQKYNEEHSLRNFNIGQLERLHCYYHWARDRVLKEHGLRHIHLTIIRSIRLSGSLTLRQLRTVTGYSRSAMNKHRDFLVERKLVRELPRKGDQRLIHVGCTERGKRELEEIDTAIEVQFVKAVGFSHRSQFKVFSLKLEETLLDLPCEQKSCPRAYAVPAETKAFNRTPSVPVATSQDEDDDSEIPF